MSGLKSGGSSCSVATCKVNGLWAKHTGASISFFKFPKEAYMRREWIRRCYRKDNFSAENNKICSKHFHEEDFLDLCRSKIMNITPKQLKPTALPCLYLKSATSSSCSCNYGNVPSASNDRSKRAKEKERKEVVSELMTSKAVQNQQQVELRESLNISEFNLVTQTTSPEGQNVVLCQNNKNICVNMQSQYTKVRNDYDFLKKEVEKLRKENNELLKKNKRLEMSVIQSQSEFERRAKEIFATVLSPNQIDILLKKKSRARWTNSEISKAFTIRYFSIRCYLYLRNELKYPLPGISTLQKWASTFSLRDGKLMDILKIMKITGETKSSFQRLTVLSFDEVKISSLFEYDEKEDEVVGPHHYMQVIMARGLCDNWKQPIYINFDEKVTKELLFEIVSDLYNIKYEVVGCVSDCGGSNMGLWNSLNININNTSVSHPVTGDKIQFFADAPHLLKLIRNWFIDKGFVKSNGDVINKQPFCHLLNMCDVEISSCFKLTPLHLNCQKIHRQNVNLAAQLFSNTSATALKKYLPGNDKKLAKNVADFVNLVGQWFDIMNAYTPIASVPTKKPYGKDLAAQDEILNEMKDVFHNMLCTSKTSLQIFQKGVLVSTTSLQELFRNLKEKYNISYLLSHRLNQDCLENLFSQLRSKGGLHDHPSPLNALYRIRMILLGKNPGIVQAHTNFMQNSDDESTQFILADAFKTARVKNLVHTSKLSSNSDSDLSVASSNSNSNTSTMETNICEEDGLQYIAGFLARKYRKQYPDLGKYTHEIEEENTVHTYALTSLPSWIQSLSFGGLTEPSETFKSQVSNMERLFKKVHKKDFQRVKNIVKRTTLFINKKLPDIPVSIIKSFVRLRIFIRIKYFNVQKKNNSILGKRKGDDESRKVVNKMRRVVN